MSVEYPDPNTARMLTRMPSDIPCPNDVAIFRALDRAIRVQLRSASRSASAACRTISSRCSRYPRAMMLAIRFSCRSRDRISSLAALLTADAMASPAASAASTAEPTAAALTLLEFFRMPVAIPSLNPSPAFSAVPRSPLPNCSSKLRTMVGMAPLRRRSSRLTNPSANASAASRPRPRISFLSGLTLSLTVLVNLSANTLPDFSPSAAATSRTVRSAFSTAGLNPPLSPTIRT